MKPGGLGSLVVNQAATAAITNLVGASWNAPAGFLQLNQVYRLRSHFTYLHTAATTPTITVELAVAGVAVASVVVTPLAVAATYHGVLEGYFTVRSLGTTGTIMASVHLSSHGLTLAAAGADPCTVNTTTTTVDTTIARLFELRARMTTAVASNTLTLAQGWVERVIG